MSHNKYEEPLVEDYTLKTNAEDVSFNSGSGLGDSKDQ